MTSGTNARHFDFQFAFSWLRTLFLISSFRKIDFQTEFHENFVFFSLIFSLKLFNSILFVFQFNFFFLLFLCLQLKSIDECDNGGNGDINHIADGNLISNDDTQFAEASATAGSTAANKKCQENIEANNINHPNANGSLITMTMTNNTLIVETEERSVSERTHRPNWDKRQQQTA